MGGGEISGCSAGTSIPPPPSLQAAWIPTDHSDGNEVKWSGRERGGGGLGFAQATLHASYSSVRTFESFALFHLIQLPKYHYKKWYDQ